MASTSPTTSPTISCVIPCSLTPRRRVSLSSSPPSSPVPSTPPIPSRSGSYDPEYITSDATPPPEWGVSRLVRFDNECAVIPDSEWFSCADHGHGEGGSSKGGFKAVFGLNKMKKVVVVNRSYSLPLWPAGGNGTPSKATDDEGLTGESGTEDEAAHQRKVMRLNFKVPIPTFSPERPQNASRHPHLRSPSVEYPAHALPTTGRGRKASRERSPSASSTVTASLSPILMHRSLSPEASQSPSRGFAAGTLPPLHSTSGEITHHPHNALYTNPRMDPATSSYFPVSSSPPAPGAPIHHIIHSASTSAIDPAVFSALPELIPLRPCCENCSKTLEEALRQGEEWKEKFSKGARRRRRRSSSAASNSSVGSSVIAVDGGGGPTTSVITAHAVVSAYPAAMVIDAVPVVTPAKRPLLTVSTVPIEEETDQELEADADAEPETETEPESAAEEAGGEPISTGKLTMAVVDEVEGLKRRSASGASLNKLAAVDKPVLPSPPPMDEVPVVSSRSSSSLSMHSLSDPTPIASTSTLPSTPRKFLDVPAFKPHGRISSEGSISSIASNGSGESVGSTGSGGSSGSRGSAGSRSSARSNGCYKGPAPKPILKNSPSNSPLPSPTTATPPRHRKRHSYNGTPKDKRREQDELLIANTLQNMNLDGKERRKNRDREQKRTSAIVIDLSEVGDLRKKIAREAEQGPKLKSPEDDDDMLFPLPKSPKGSPGGTPDGSPCTGNTPRTSTLNTPRASNTPDFLTPRGGSPRASPRPSPKASPYSSPRISPRSSPFGSPSLSPRNSPRASPRMKPSPLAVVSPVNARGDIELVQGGTSCESGTDSEDGLIKGSLVRKAPSHSRTLSEPSVRTSTSTVSDRTPSRSPAVIVEDDERKEEGYQVVDYFSFPHDVNQSPQRPRKEAQSSKQKSKERERSISTGSPSASASSRSPKTKSPGDVEHSPKQGRKNTTSFSSFGRNLRVLGADIMKGVGSISGMNPPGGY